MFVESFPSQYVVDREFRARRYEHVDAASDFGAVSLSRGQNSERSLDKALRIRGSHRHERSPAPQRRPATTDTDLSSEGRLVREESAIRAERLHRHTGLRQAPSDQNPLQCARMVEGC